LAPRARPDPRIRGPAPPGPELSAAAPAHHLRPQPEGRARAAVRDASDRARRPRHPGADRVGPARARPGVPEHPLQLRRRGPADQQPASLRRPPTPRLPAGIEEGMDPLMRFLRGLVALSERIATSLQWFSPLLARLTVGLVFFQSGWGKLHNLAKVIDYF